MNKIFTIGHSNIGIDELLRLLVSYGINCVVDVRTMPTSTYSPQFNKGTLKTFLTHNGITYAHFGEEFGARRTDCVVNGQVNFEEAVKTEKFQRGCMRLNHAMSLNFNLALMCSEANPLECHRFSLVSRFFHEHGIEVLHILKDGSLKTHKALEEEMIEAYLTQKTERLRKVETNLFGETYSYEQQRIDAYRLKNKEIGYQVNESTH